MNEPSGIITARAKKKAKRLFPFPSQTLDAVVTAIQGGTALPKPSKDPCTRLFLCGDVIARWNPDTSRLVDLFPA